MAQVSGSLPVFRNAFRVVNKESLQWFPGHMGKGLKQMQQKLKSIDCVIEVHDARIPFSGRNLDFKNTISSIKPHILVLNKRDLIPQRTLSEITKRLQGEHRHVIFTNCKNQRCDGVKKLIPLTQELIAKSCRFNRGEEREFCMMIIGVPNVGKSSLVNILRNRHLHKSGVSHVGAVPGITRSVLNRIKISENPLMYLLDTPGILTPSVASNETGLKLALCACLQDHLVGADVIADYLLFWMNKEGNFRYVELMGLAEPCDDIGQVLSVCAQKLNKTHRIKNYDGLHVLKPDFNAAALHMIRAFRTGQLGKICLDADILQSL